MGGPGVSVRRAKPRVALGHYCYNYWSFLNTNVCAGVDPHGTARRRDVWGGPRV
jgi:hypothetical protein